MYFAGKIFYYVTDFGALLSHADFPPELVTMKAVLLQAVAIFALSNPTWKHKHTKTSPKITSICSHLGSAAPT